MTRFAIVTLFPEIFEGFRSCGVFSRALQDNLIDLSFWNPRDAATDIHKTVDDKPYGGGPGMVLMAEPLSKMINAACKTFSDQEIVPKVVYLSPRGKAFDQCMAQELAREKAIVLICGRYEGIDQRVIDHIVDVEISVGDFVVSGGEIPAMLLVDAVSRCIPDVIGDAESVVQDSFYSGLLDNHHFTRPDIFQGESVPEVLLEGNHAKIASWRKEEALKVTLQRRPDLLTDRVLSREEQSIISALFMDEK